MKLDALQVEIRQRTVGQTVAVATRLLQQRPWPLLTAWALYSAPVIALALGLLVYGGLSPFWSWSALLLLAPIFSLPMVATVGHLVFSPSVKLRTVLAVSLQRGATFLALFFLSRLIVLAGLVAAVVPGLYLWRSSWFLAPIVVLEQAPAGASFRRGRRFAAGYQSTVMLHALNAAALVGYWTLAIAATLHFLGVGVIGMSVPIVGDLARYDDYLHALTMVGFALAIPFVTLVWFFVYLDVRTRKEGWDLELAFRARAQQLERGRA